ncbi:MAG: class I tRNA ligase family protein, partial [Candidatus Acidiferrales bacterium]
YPTSLLISGYDILFFWDARMIMMGLKLMDRAKIEERIPFHRLYLHSIVRDPHGMKMSKTRGNVVDPLELTEKHGTDALRFALAVMAAPGTDIALSEDHILGYRAFANKIWNAARFLFFNLEKVDSLGVTLEDLAAPDIREEAPYDSGGEMALVDRWIFSRIATVRDEISDALENFRFHEAAHVIYHFFWGDFCDWYIEWVKPRLGITDRAAALAVWRNLFSVFESALRLLHPFMPFLTEELWHKLPQRAGAKSIALEQFPAARPDWRNVEAEKQMAFLQEVIVAVRNLRAEIKVDPKRKIAAEFATGESTLRSLVEGNLDSVLNLAALSELKITTGRLDSSGGLTRSAAQYDLRLAHSEPVDTEAESARLRKEIERLVKDIDSKRSRLADGAFRSRAPEQVVRSLENTLAERQAEHQKLELRLKQIAPANPN